MLRSVVLPQPERAQDAHDLAFPDGHGDVCERLHMGPVGKIEPHGDVFDAQFGH